MKKKTKIFITVFICLFIAGVSAVAGINIYIVNYSKPYIITPEEAKKADADCVLALGAQVFSDGTPCDQLYDRVLFASEIHLGDKNKKLLLSGDSHDSSVYDEITAMTNVATSLGVKKAHILTDPVGVNTLASMKNMKKIFDFNSSIIVTQEYHVYRSVYLARKLGIDAYGVASDPRSYASMPFNSVREIFARVKAFFCVEFIN